MARIQVPAGQRITLGFRRVGGREEPAVVFDLFAPYIPARAQIVAQPGHAAHDRLADAVGLPGRRIEGTGDAGYTGRDQQGTDQTL